MAVTQENATAEDVPDHMDPHTADMRQRPFDNDSFNVIVSSVAIHNISAKAGRDQAIDEARHVLHPGGRLLIADFSQKRSIQEATSRTRRHRRSSQSRLAHVVERPVGADSFDRRAED